jgi:hypothetical protein
MKEGPLRQIRPPNFTGNADHGRNGTNPVIAAFFRGGAEVPSGE